jgi:hypothetical protein
VFDSRAIRSGIRWAADQANPYVPAPDCAYSGTTACYSTGGANDRPWGVRHLVRDRHRLGCGGDPLRSGPEARARPGCAAAPRDRASGRGRSAAPVGRGPARPHGRTGASAAGRDSSGGPPRAQ